MNQPNNQIIKWEANQWLTNNIDISKQNIIFKKHEKCTKCDKVHYYNSDRDYCVMTNLFNFVNIK